MSEWREARNEWKCGRGLAGRVGYGEKEIAQPAHKALKSLSRIGTQECGTSPAISMQKREIFRCLIIADPPIHWVHLLGPLRAVKLFTEGRDTDNLLFSRGPRGKQVFCILSLAVVKSHHGRDAFQNNSFCEGPFPDQLYGYRILVWRHLWQCGKQAISGSALASAHFKVTTLHWCLVKTFANALRYTSG